MGQAGEHMKPREVTQRSSLHVKQKENLPSAHLAANSALQASCTHHKCSSISCSTRLPLVGMSVHSTFHANCMTEMKNRAAEVSSCSS